MEALEADVADVLADSVDHHPVSGSSEAASLHGGPDFFDEESLLARLAN